MSDNPLSSGWTNVDDEQVPVRVASSAAPASQKISASPASVDPQQEHTHHKRAEASIAPNPGAMRLSAFAGIAIVLIFGALYLGIDSLRGSLTNDTASGTTVTITADGQFSPSNVSVTAGGTLVLENKNKDPQVIKVRGSGSELFPVQVLFDTPYTFVIPVDVTGVFTYVSETLPDSQQLTITVTPAMEATAAPTPDAASNTNSLPISDPQAVVPIPDTQTPQNTADIPLPFGESDARVAAQTTEVPVLDTSVSVQPTEQATTITAATEDGNATEIFSVGASKSSAEPTSVQPSGTIAINPYTVGSAKNEGSTIAKSAKNLHSGAPLLQARRRPSMNASTGPAAWGVFLGSILLMMFAYQFLLRKFE